MKLIVRPMQYWPMRLHIERTKPPFRADWSATRALLRREAKALNCEAVQVVLELAVTPADIRHDGELRAQFRPPGMPGVIAYVIGPTGQSLRLYTDRYTTWLGNARAIALTMNALRAVGRYGVGSGNEAYIGFQELPAPAIVGLMEGSA